MNEKIPSFDELMDIAANDPSQFENLRQALIDDAIEAAPSDYRRRLTGLQFTIDAERQKHKSSPMGSCLRIYELMQESFAELQQSLNLFCENPFAATEILTHNKHTQVPLDNLVEFKRR